MSKSTDEALESWRMVWRQGFAPNISTYAMLALKKALEEDSPAIIQGATTSPPPLMCVMDWPVEAACAISFCGWQGEDMSSVAEVEEYFARLCFGVDQKLGEPAACRWFLNWFDETPRDEMREKLLGEINLVLENRSQATVA